MTQTNTMTHREPGSGCSTSRARLTCRSALRTARASQGMATTMTLMCITTRRSMRSSVTCPTHCVRGKYGPRCHVPSRGHERTQQEITTHTERGHWKIMKVSNVPIGTKILPAVSAMRRKRRILSREVYKWKARLNVHGGKQTHGVDYLETYAAALNWSSIRFFLTQALIHGWHTRQLNFVLAYPQDADVECNLYLEIPQRFTFAGDPLPQSDQKSVR